MLCPRLAGQFPPPRCVDDLSIEGRGEILVSLGSGTIRHWVAGHFDQLGHGASKSTDNDGDRLRMFLLGVSNALLCDDNFVNTITVRASCTYTGESHACTLTKATLLPNKFELEC